MKLFPKLVFDKIIDHTSLNDTDNLKKGLEKSPYEKLLTRRLERKNKHPFLCHLCFADEKWSKIRKLAIDPAFDLPECWSGLIEEEKWNENGVKLKTKSIDTLAVMDEDMSELNAFQRRGKRKFIDFMFGLQNDSKKLLEQKAVLQDVLRNIELFYGLDRLIEHIEKNHHHKKNLLDLYEAISDTYKFNLESLDIRDHLNPNAFIGIHRIETFLSIGNAYVMNDTSAWPINRHMSLDIGDIILVAVRDLLEKTIEAYQQMVLFKPPYDAVISFDDEYYRERIRIKHFKSNLACIQNCKVILDLIIPYKY